MSASPAGGLYNAAQTVTLTASEPAAIYYTTDGSAPTTASSRYTAPIQLTTVSKLQFFAVDTAGNQSAVGSEVYTIDTEAPETAIDSGPTGTVTSNAARFEFSTTEEDATFECRLDGAPFQACASPNEYTGLADGQHTFEVRAIDAVGNIDPTPASRTWTIDTTPVPEQPSFRIHLPLVSR